MTDEQYHEHHGKVYEKFGVSSRGYLVVIRPDGYVSFIGDLEDVKGVENFFAGCMIAANDRKPVAITQISDMQLPLKSVGTGHV